MQARLLNRTVVEILNAVPGFSIEQCFHPDILATSAQTPIDVQLGWTVEEDGTIKDAEGVVQYTPPVVEPESTEETLAEEVTVETPAETIVEPLTGEDNGQPTAL
jgi:hypothetical protein